LSFSVILSMFSSDACLKERWPTFHSKIRSQFFLSLFHSLSFHSLFSIPISFSLPSLRLYLPLQSTLEVLGESSRLRAGEFGQNPAAKRILSLETKLSSISVIVFRVTFNRTVDTLPATLSQASQKNTEHLEICQGSRTRWRPTQKSENGNFPGNTAETVGSPASKKAGRTQYADTSRWRQWRQPAGRCYDHVTKSTVHCQ